MVYINVEDFENRIYVGIENSGLGPLTIKGFRVYNSMKEFKDKLIDYMPELPNNYAWSNFFGNPVGYVLKEGKIVTLIEIEARNLSIDNTDLAGDEQFLPEGAFILAFSSTRNQIRHALSDLTIEIEYEDIYENKMPIVKRKLDWFSRNLGPTNISK